MSAYAYSIQVQARCNTKEDAVKLVAERINKAAGETLVEVEG